MATKTVALKIDIQGNAELTRLQRNFDLTKKELKLLTKAERVNGRLTKEQIAERARLNVELKANRNALTDQQNAILKNNNALKKNSGFVAGIKKGIGGWATSMIALTAGIGAASKLIGGINRIIKDFDKSVSGLASVLGKSKDEIKSLTTQAKNLGATTAFTASQVIELQTEFAKLGFPTDDIENMTASTLDAAAALGSELGEQAALSGAVLKQYGLDSTETARVNDVLAKSASSSALDFSKLATALPIVGATANAAGVNLERTTALLGTLSDRGIDASTAATSLRNIFLELSKKGITWEQAMAKINNATDKNAVAMDLFGKRSATAGIILAESGESLDKLEEGLRNAEGAAKDMADTMLDNLAGDITKAGSAWEGFILSLEDGEGNISKLMRNVVSLFSTALEGLTQLNKSSKQIAKEMADRVINPMVESGRAAAQELKKQYEEAGLAGESLADALDRASKQQAEFSRQARDRGDTNLAGNYAAEVLELRKLSDELRNANEVTTSPELTPEQKEAIKKKAEARAKAEREARLLAERKLNEEQQVDSIEADISGELDPEFQMKLAQQKTFQEMSFIEQQLFLAKQAELSQNALNEDLENNKKNAEAKRAIREANVQMMGDFINAGLAFAKEGSVEQKALASALALVQTYQSAQAAYLSQLTLDPTSPFRAAAAASIAVATGLGNVAKINAIQFADGGILKGASHANGGIPFTVAGRGGFEAEGGEAIINKRSTSMFTPLLSAINEAGGGKRLFQDGGLTPNIGGANALQQTIATQPNMMQFAETIIEGINNLEVINVATNTTDLATEVLNVTSEATF